MKFDEKSIFFLNPPFFISMTTAAKLVDKSKQSESVGQTLPLLPWKQKGGFKIILDSFHQTS
jgi:hypothetical protein